MPRYTYNKIAEATDDYVSELQEVDMKLILQEIIKFEAPDIEGEICLFEYPGMLNISVDTLKKDIRGYKVPGFGTLNKIYKPRPRDCRYQMGIFSVGIPTDDEEVEAAHYVAVALDNENKEVWLWDSAVTDSTKEATETRHAVQTLFPKYKLCGTKICGGCGMYQPGAGAGDERSYQAQNIFCHTWSIWFLRKLILAINDGRTIRSEVTTINKNCKARKENLVLIKKFAKYFASEYFSEEYKLPPAFDYVWSKASKKAVKVLN